MIETMLRSGEPPHIGQSPEAGLLAVRTPVVSRVAPMATPSRVYESCSHWFAPTFTLSM